MKKSIKIIAIICFITLSKFSFSKPIFGLPGQGIPVWDNSGITKCNPGFSWCKISYMNLSPRNKFDLLEFNANPSSEEVVISISDQLVKKMIKMIQGDILIISEHVILDEKLSLELKKEMKSKVEGMLVLKKGQYKIVKVKGGIQVSTRYHDYVGHVTLLK